jgi:hypothetical protein
MAVLQAEQIPINYHAANEVLASCTELQRVRCSELLTQKGSSAVADYTRGWQNMAILYQEFEREIGPEKAGKFFDRVFAITDKQIQRWLKALEFRHDPRTYDVVKHYRDPERIIGAADQFLRGPNQLIAAFDEDRIDVDTFDPRTIASDRLKTTPNISGVIGEATVKAILDGLGWTYKTQDPSQYLCDFGESKQPDFTVKGIAAKKDTTLAAGFYIEVTTRLSCSDKDLGLYYLAHQCAFNSTLPTIIVFDGPGISERVQNWARSFVDKNSAPAPGEPGTLKPKRNANGGCLYWVFTLQQFREWAQVKVGRQG